MHEKLVRILYSHVVADYKFIGHMGMGMFAFAFAWHMQGRVIMVSAVFCLRFLMELIFF